MPTFFWVFHLLDLIYHFNVYHKLDIVSSDPHAHIWNSQWPFSPSPRELQLFKIGFRLAKFYHLVLIPCCFQYSKGNWGNMMGSKPETHFSQYSKCNGPHNLQSIKPSSCDSANSSHHGIRPGWGWMTRI